MTEKSQLPFILSLLDDPSPSTRKAVIKELVAYGNNLDAALDSLPNPPSPAERRKIQETISHFIYNEKGKAWLDWLDLNDDYARLEKAMIYLSAYQNEFNSSDQITSRLDDLAREFSFGEYDCNIFGLSDFLFGDLGYGGNREDYYHIQNNDLDYVLKHKKGLPITLVIIYMLVGHRVGIAIDGFNFPGHFMAKAQCDDQWYIIDCFSHGEIFNEREFLRANVGGNLSASKSLFKTNAKIIIGRVLRNLARAYQQMGDVEKSRQVVDLLKDLGK